MALNKFDGQWNTKCDRFVGFLDIVGFKNMVSTSSHDDVEAKMKTLSQLQRTLDWKQFTIQDVQAVVRITVFSDSIIVVTNNASPYSASYLQQVLSYIIYYCFKSGIPIKGSIAYGLFTYDPENSLFIGKPLIDAFLLQEELNVYSVVLHHTYEAFVKNENDPFHSIPFEESGKWMEYKTPFKTGASHHYLLNWPLYLSVRASTNPNVYKEVYNYINCFYNTVSGKTRAYVDNTMEIYKYSLKINGVILDM